MKSREIKKFLQLCWDTKIHKMMVNLCRRQVNPIYEFMKTKHENSEVDSNETMNGSKEDFLSAKGDKRKHPRIKVKIVARLSMGIYLEVYGHTRNISLKGISVKVPNLFELIRSDKVNVISGIDVSAIFPNDNIHIKGKVIRVDQDKKEIAIAIAISKIKNKREWKELCSL